MADFDIPEPVASFLEAVNQHDEKVFDTWFAAVPVVDDWGTEFRGLDRINAWSAEQFVGSEPTLTVADVADRDGAIVVTGDWRSTHANGPSSFAFTVEGDKISSMTIREG
ncbi:nuclear transport factor 2 family protein [Dietzia sp.]|uniref:nuclear transport factor 2 family protein n=1 Tax=Dietzia sp. TaxID=1871616 RepID=UPI002FDA97B6